MPIYEEKRKINNQKIWYIRTYIESENGKRKQVTVHNKSWVGREGFYQAQQKENELRNKIFTNYHNITLNALFNMYSKYINEHLRRSSIIKTTDNYRLFIGPRLGFKKFFPINHKRYNRFPIISKQTNNKN